MLRIKGKIYSKFEDEYLMLSFENVVEGKRLSLSFIIYFSKM